MYSILFQLHAWLPLLSAIPFTSSQTWRWESSLAWLSLRIPLFSLWWFSCLGLLAIRFLLTADASTQYTRDYPYATHVPFPFSLNLSSVSSFQGLPSVQHSSGYIFPHFTQAAITLLALPSGKCDLKYFFLLLFLVNLQSNGCHSKFFIPINHYTLVFLFHCLLSFLFFSFCLVLSCLFVWGRISV